jgi:hypothetical protein
VKKSQVKIVLYSTFALVVLALMMMREFVWRYQSPFSLRIKATLSNGADTANITVYEYTGSSVDTVRSEFKDSRSGVTKVMIVNREKNDSLYFIAHGHYYSNSVPITFSTDRARELLLIPNTEQGLALGVGELIYLDTAGQLSAIHVQSPNVGDVDSDGVFEIYDMSVRKFLHLDRAEHKWNVALQVNHDATKSQ